MVFKSPRPIYLSVYLKSLWTKGYASLIKIIHVSNVIPNLMCWTGIFIVSSWFPSFPTFQMFFLASFCTAGTTTNGMTQCGILSSDVSFIRMYVPCSLHPTLCLPLLFKMFWKIPRFFPFPRGRVFFSKIQSAGYIVFCWKIEYRTLFFSIWD